MLLSAIFFREFLPWQIYASLVPIIGGVALASLKEVSFSWLSFIAGTGSAVTSASKAILSKKVLDGKVRRGQTLKGCRGHTHSLLSLP